MIAASPRFSPPPTPLSSIVIHAFFVVLWVLLFTRAFMTEGLFAWSIGIAYAAYDTSLLALVFALTFNLAKKTKASERHEPSASSPKYSLEHSLGVIIAAHNEAAVLPMTLAALFAQTEPPEMIIIADDGSTDATATLLEEKFGLVCPELGSLSLPSSLHSNLRWLRLPHGRKPAALNSAIMLVETDIVLTVDADTLLEPSAIAAMRDAFAADPHLAAATGVLTPVCAPTPSGRILQWFQTYEYIRNFLSRYAWMQMHSLLLISGAFAAFRTDAVLRVGGFDPACLVEDYELIHRLRRYSVLHGLGWTTGVVGSSRALTDAPGSPSAFLRQRRRWFGGFLQTQLWYRDMVGNRAYGLLGLVMLPIKAADTLQPIYGLTALGLLIAYLATGRFALINPASGVIGLKILIDFAFYLWSIHLYKRWAKPLTPVSFKSGLLAALLEPFSFQILRHLGAAWGWIIFLTGERNWGVQRRFGLVALAPELAPEAERGAQD